MALDKLQRIILKNFRLLLRSKASALIVVLGPLIIISLIGLAFSNSQPYGVTVATYAPEYNELANSIIATMDEQRFKVDRIVSESACEQRVKQSKANICLVFPKGFTIGDSSANNITFHVDYSKINLVWSVLEVISTKIASRSTEISRDLTGELVKSLQMTQGEVEKNLPEVVDLSIKTTQIATLGDDITKNVNGMELELDAEDFQVGTLENRVKLVVDTANDAASRGRKIIDDIQGSYDSFNMTASQRAALEELFDDAEQDLEVLRDSLADMYAEGNASSLLGDVIRGLGDKLEATEQQLRSAANAREVVIGDVKNAKALLEGAAKKIDALQASLDAVQRNIQGIAITDPSKIVAPITTTIKPLSVDTHFNYLFPALIVLIIMITGVLLSAMLVIVEKKSTAFFRNFITPTNEIVFLLGTLITTFSIMLLQLIIFLTVAHSFFDTNVLSTITTAGPVLLAITLLFIFLGMLIGTLFQSEETTILAAISCCALLLFLSSTILPLESMPPTIQRIADYNPFVMSEDLLRQTIIFEFDYSLIAGELLLLLLYAALLFALVVVLSHLLRVHTLYKIHKEKPQKKRMADQAAVVAAKPTGKHWWSLGKKSQSTVVSAAKPEQKSSAAAQPVKK